MSVVSARLRRLVIVTLTFACAGPVIQAVAEAALTSGSLLLSGAEVHGIRGIAPGYLAQMLLSSAVASGVTGIVAGLCEMGFGPLTAGAMVGVSLMVPAVLLALLIATVPPFTDVVMSGNLGAVFIFLGPTVISAASFVASMMACFKLTGILAGRIPGAGRPSLP